MELTLPKISPPAVVGHKKAEEPVPDWLKPGMHACCHGSGWTGSVIRKAELALSNDPVASWAGHCIVYVGNQVLIQGHDPEPCIVEATYPNCRMASIHEHNDAIWAHQPLTPRQQLLGQVAALALVGRYYDWFSYFSFLNRLVHAQFLNNLDPLFKETARIGPICSGVVVRVEGAMKIAPSVLAGLPTAAIEDPDFVSPADVLAWDIKEGWVSPSQVPVTPL